MPDDLSLVVDQRAEIAGPGLHVLLIGISDYAFLRPPDEPPGEGLAALTQLASPALSAFRFRAKLEALDHDGRLPWKLKTLRMLLAPSAAELAAEPALAGAAAAANRLEIRDALRLWRDDMAESRDGCGLFYFGGHGIRRALEESILLAGDFLNPADEIELENAFRLSNVRAGMAPSQKYPEIGRTQFYFVDACRDKPDALDALDDTQTPKMFSASLNTLDDRKAPIYFATYVGGLAAGNPGEETYFYKAIDWALEHASPESASAGNAEIWPVTAFSLKAGIERQNSLFAGRVELTGLIGNPIICFRTDPPTFDVKISIAPEALRPSVATARLVEINRDESIDLPGGSDPRIASIRAGLYRLEVEASDTAFPRVRTNAVRLAFDYQMPWEIRVGP